MLINSLCGLAMLNGMLRNACKVGFSASSHRPIGDNRPLHSSISLSRPGRSVLTNAVLVRNACRLTPNRQCTHRRRIGIGRSVIVSNPVVPEKRRFRQLRPSPPQDASKRAIQKPHHPLEPGNLVGLFFTLKDYFLNSSLRPHSTAPRSHPQSCPRVSHNRCNCLIDGSQMVGARLDFQFDLVT
jgi:hypothetical protein